MSGDQTSKVAGEATETPDSVLDEPGVRATRRNVATRALEFAAHGHGELPAGFMSDAVDCLAGVLRDSERAMLRRVADAERAGAAGWRAAAERHEVSAAEAWRKFRESKRAAREEAWHDGVLAVGAFAAETGQSVDVANHAALPELLRRNPYADTSKPLAHSTCAGHYSGTIRDLVHRLEVCVAEEQELANPRNHFIAVFCDVIRYMREEGARPFAPVGGAPEPADPLDVLGYEQGLEVCERQEGWLVITGKEGEDFNPAALFFNKERAEQYCELKADDGDGNVEHVAFDACAVEAILYRNRIVTANDYTIEGCAALRAHTEEAMSELEAAPPVAESTTVEKA